MNNWLQPGDIVTLVAPYTTLSGAGCKVGSIFGVATNDVTSGASGEYKTTGAFNLACLTTDTPSQGDILYWDNTNKYLTTTSSGNSKVATCLITKTSGPTIVAARLNGFF